MLNSQEKVKLNTQYELLKRIAEDNNQAFLVYDIKQSSFIYLNSYCGKLSNLDIEDIYKKPSIILSIIHPDDRQFVYDAFKLFKGNLNKKKLSFRLLSPDESFKWLCVSAHLILNIYGKPEKIIVLADDITGSKQHELYLLEKTSEKNSILEILSHDLRNPLFQIKLISQLLKKEHSEEDIKKYTLMMNEVCDRSLNMILQFTNQEYLDSVGIEVKKTRVDIVERVLSILGQYKVLENNLVKKFILKPSSEKIWVEIDDVKFMQVINNLISNAIKFTREDGIIEVILEDCGEILRVIVKDDGIGIPEKMIPLLFDKFTKAKRKGLKGEDTVGLGMSIIKTIVELHNGRIWVESRENQGTSFFIEIPK